MIPKLIHYVWLGGTKDSIAKKAIETWKKKAPGFQIIEWNEKNLPNYTNQFYKNALANKDYAFASDYVRLMLLHHYGGIYLDTDMFLLSDPSSILENYDLVFGIQDKNMIFSTSFIASVPNQEFINKALKVYDHLEYTKNDLKPNTELLSPLMLNMYGFKHDTHTQIRGKVAAYNPDILLQPSFHTVAMHIGEKSWSSHSRHDEMRIQLRKRIKNRLEAGIFRMFNDIARKLIPDNI